MAMFKNYFVDDTDVVPEPPMPTADEYSTPELEDIYSGLRSAGVSPEAGQRSVDMTRRLAGVVVPPPEGELPSDWAQIQAASKAPEAKSIPVKAAPATKDVAAPTASALAPTTADKPAGKPDSAGKTGLPAPETGGGGDDEMSSLRKQLGLQQMFEALGSAGSGKNLYTDGGVLADRMKQLEALRAKREEQSLEQQRERATWGASNRATLASFMAQYKDRPEVVEALKAQEPGADTTKPSDYLKNLVGSLTTPPKVRGLEAGVAKTEAGTGQTLERTATDVATRPGKVEKLQTAAALDRARIDALQNKARVDVTTSSKEAREAKVDARAAEAAVTRAMERANDKNDVTNTANNFTALEEVAPGFAKGQKPEWIGRFTLQKAMEVPAISDKAAALNSALENFTANIRKTLFGASLTGNEKASFDLIVNRKLTATPEQLAAAVNTLRRGAARFAQNHFTTSMEFHPQETARVLRSSAVYGPALREGGIYSDVWTLPAAPAQAGGASSKQQKPQASEGYTPLWNKAQGKWQEIPNEKAEAAKASGRFEE